MPAVRQRTYRRHTGSKPWAASRGTLTTLASELDWQEKGLCREVGTELFFADTKGASNLPAKKVCAACPVRAMCLEWALSFPQIADEYGVFGGTGPKERQRLRAQRNKIGVAA